MCRRQDKPRHARQLINDQVNGGLVQATPVGILHVQVDLDMRLAVDGVTWHVGGMHDHLSPAGNTGAWVEWV